MKKKKTGKKVAAPKSFDPGGGRPREYLAYLNYHEMEALRRLNGEGPYKGPKGIPSFVLGGFGAAGSGTYSSSGQQQKSATTGARGPTGPGGEARSSPAGNAGGAPGASSRTSSGGGGLGQGGQGNPSKSTGGGLSSKDLGIAGVPGGVSRTGGALAQAGKPTGSGGQGPSNTLSAPARTAPSVGSTKAPASPMGGQGTSFSTPAQAASFNADRVAQQTGQIKDAIKGVQNVPSLDKDLSAGGIKTINVGPMGTPVDVQSIARLSPMEKNPNFADRVIGAAGSIAASISDAAAAGIGSLFGGPTKAEGQLGSEAYDRVPQSPSFPGNTFDQTTGMVGTVAGKTFYDRVPTEAEPVSPVSVERMREQYSMYNNPAAGVSGIGAYKYSSPIGPTQPGSLDMGDIAARNQRMAELASMPDEAFQGYDKYDPLSSLKVNTPLNRTIEQAEYRPYDIRVPTERILEVEDVPPERPTNFFGMVPGAGLKRRASEAVYTPGDYEAYRSQNVPSGTIESFRDVEGVDSPFIDPVTQMPAYPEKTKVQKFAEKIPRVGQALKLASWAGEKEFSRLSPQEQADLMGKWVSEQDAYRGAGQGSQKERPNLPYSFGAGAGLYAPPSTDSSAPQSSSSGPRPEIYYSWDLGANIPSPTSPDYTLYLKYLNEKAAAQAALGII